jgi:hypothetical protein
VKTVSQQHVSTATWITNETFWLPSIASKDDVNNVHSFASRIVPLFQAIVMARNPQYALDLPVIDAVSFGTSHDVLPTWHVGLLDAVLTKNGKQPVITRVPGKTAPNSENTLCYERAVLTSVATTVVWYPFNLSRCSPRSVGD